MPVGTQGTVKCLTPEQVESTGAQIVLANTYHLYLRPGSGVVRRLGGLHKFMGWAGPILTDSGGFQVMSLSMFRKVTDEGVVFKSHIDGSEHFFSPEKAILVQSDLGSDIMMALDQCVPYPCDPLTVAEAADRTARWAERCKAASPGGEGALFGIIQGGAVPHLRRRSASRIVSIGFDGYAVGGLSVGEPKQVTYEMLEEVEPLIPRDSPRYVMGLGSPDDIVEAVARGMDLMDSVLPTRLARHAALFTSSGRINIKNAAYAEDERPIDDECDCYACRYFSRAYIRHLFRCGEVLGFTLATVHNLRFLVRLMERARQAIAEDRFEEIRDRARTPGEFP
jgi:queuine tRNA-ribosyltransferase